METYDVIIVGAGPAGTATALHLQRLAPELIERTLVLEKSRHPRTKLCGGGILPDGLRILQRLGLDFNEVPYTRILRAHFEFDGRGTALTGEGAESLHVVLREDLDAWLARKAQERGVTLQEETPVRRIIPGDSFVTVVTADGEYRARVVVGADGAHSVVRRAIAPHQRVPYSRALVLWVPPKPESSSHAPEDAYFDFTCIREGVPGYIWDFPILVHGQPMRCWGITDNGVGPHHSRPLRPLLAREMARHGYRLEDYPLYGESVPHFGVCNVFSAPGVLLVGDALGVDFLYGEGIAPALGYGQLAARAIVDAFAEGDFSFRDYRERVLQSPLGQVLRRRALTASLIFRLRHPAMQRFFWHRLGQRLRTITERYLTNWA
jgi:flavin-dependent dehydrogenase